MPYLTQIVLQDSDDIPSKLCSGALRRARSSRRGRRDRRDVGALALRERAATYPDVNEETLEIFDCFVQS